MNKLDLKQALVVMGYTGYSTVGFGLFHEDVEKRLGESIFTHQFPALKDRIKEAYKEDFIAMCLDDTFDKV